MVTKATPAQSVPCVMPGCDRTAQIKMTSMCLRCHTWQRYWKGRSKKDRYQRYAQLKFWQKRASGYWSMK